MYVSTKSRELGWRWLFPMFFELCVLTFDHAIDESYLVYGTHLIDKWFHISSCQYLRLPLLA